MTKVDDKDKGTPDDWIARNEHMIRLVGRHPFNAEAPLDLLMKQGKIKQQNSLS